MKNIQRYLKERNLIKRIQNHKKLEVKLKDNAKTLRAVLKDNQTLFGGSIYGGLNNGGLYNNYSGIGGGNDKSRQSFFLPTLIDNRTVFETIHNESWAAKRFIDLPVNQMFVRPRIIENLDEQETQQYQQYFHKFKLNELISNAMKSARLYGTAYLMFITKEAPLNTPLRLNMLQPGDLQNILVFDRFSAFVTNREYDIRSRNYQRPYIYHVAPKWGGAFQIHHTRMVRFDGQQPLSSDGWTVYNIDYGVSELIPVIQSIYQEAQAANGVSQLIEESSIPVMKIDGFKDLLGPAPPPDSPSLDNLASMLNQFKSIYNTIHMDTNDEFSRQEVSFQGLPEILDRFAARLAAAAEIPATVFLGKSPLGMNATGESDLAINAAKVQADQENKLRPIYNHIDGIMMRTSDLQPRKLVFSFPSLLDLSDETKADILLKKSEAIVPLVNSEIIQIDEARESLSDEDLLGELPPIGFDFQKELTQAENQSQNEDSSKGLFKG